MGHHDPWMSELGVLCDKKRHDLAMQFADMDLNDTDLSSKGIPIKSKPKPIVQYHGETNKILI